jgi:hypothetical protein
LFHLGNFPTWDTPHLVHGGGRGHGADQLEDAAALLVHPPSPIATGAGSGSKRGGASPVASSFSAAARSWSVRLRRT